MSRTTRGRRSIPCIAGLLCILSLCTIPAIAAGADSTALLLRQRAADLRNPLTVLTVTLRPGEEDLATLAHLRMGLGARLMNVYVTNGESGEQDRFWEYAPFLAARRREAAAEVMRQLEGEAYFLGMPDLLPDDTLRTQGRWSADTLVTRLARVISQFRPDVILLFRDPEMGSASPVLKAVREGMLLAVRQTADPTPGVAAAARPRFDRWTVLRVFEEGDGQLRLPNTRTIPGLAKAPATIATEIGDAYAFMAASRSRWKRQGTFRRIHPEQGAPDRDLDHTRLGVVPARYSGIARQLSTIASGMRQKMVRREELLRQIVVAIDSVERAMRYVLEITHRDRRLLTYWKMRLEDARIAVLGIRVHYAWSETILTDRQLTFFRVDTILNLPRGGTTELYFPATQSGWGVDENVDPWLPLEFGREYRVLSPGGLPLNLPHWEHGLPRFGVGNPFLVAIVHKGKSRQESFMYRITTRLSYSTRFNTEFLTPLVRVIPEERIAVRLTNHSRDGVADRLVVGDSTVFLPAEMPFALSTKGATVTDTLTVHGLPSALAYGNYLVPVKIGPIPVGEIGARHFPASVDSTRRVWVATNRQDPPVWQALRRLGIISRKMVRAEEIDGLAAGDCDVLIVDRNALLTMPDLSRRRPALQRFVAGGGRLVVLAQDAEAWSAGPILEGLALTPAVDGSRVQQIVPDSTKFPFAAPNIIGADLTLGWSHRTYYHIISPSQGNGPATDRVPPALQTYLAGPSGAPLIAGGADGKGQWLYVDLALDAQWMNIDPAAFRLLANIISAR